MLKNTVPNSQKTADQISIFRYNTNAASVKNKIKLQLNLFSFLLEGEKTVHYAGTQVKIKPHQFLLLSAGNCLMSDKIATKGGRYRSILLSFDNIILADFCSRHPQKLSTAAGKSHEVPFLLFEKDAFLVNFTESLGLMLAPGQPISANMRKVKLEELLLYLSENYPGQIQKLQNICQQADEDILIRQAVTDNIDNSITVEELAFLCNTSLSTFKRRFAKIYGTSPSKWLLEKKMQKAAQMLKQGEYKVSEIYYEFGYENLSSFIQSFKQVHGITPRQYQLSK
jgi:AraC-like DNA-binding protein